VLVVALVAMMVMAVMVAVGLPAMAFAAPATADRPGAVSPSRLPLQEDGQAASQRQGDKPVKQAASRAGCSEGEYQRIEAIRIHGESAP